MLSLLRPSMAGLELQRHGLLLGVSVLDEIQHGLGVEAGAVEVKHALGPDVLELRVYLAVGGVERGHGGLGIALGVDLAGLQSMYCTFVSGLSIFVRLVQSTCMRAYWSPEEAEMSNITGTNTWQKAAWS